MTIQPLCIALRVDLKNQVKCHGAQNISGASHDEQRSFKQLR